MYRFAPVVSAAFSVASLVGCGAPNAVGYEDGKPLAAIDELQRQTPHPDPTLHDDDVTSRVETDVAAPPAVVFDFIVNLKLEKVLLHVESIPATVGTKVLTPQWRDVGSRRSVILEDDTSALEEIIVSEPPSLFRYVVWNFSGDTGKAADHAVGEFAVSPAGTDGATSHIVWTYRFRPKGWPYSYFLRRRVESDFHDFMRAALEQIRLQTPKTAR